MKVFVSEHELMEIDRLKNILSKQEYDKVWFVGD